MRHWPTPELDSISDITEMDSGGRSDWPADDTVLELSGTGHWLLEGWIGDHTVDFIVDSGSSVTAICENFADYSWLDWHRLENKPTNRTLWGASGATIRVSGLLTFNMPVLVTNFSQETVTVEPFCELDWSQWYLPSIIKFPNSRSSTSLAWAGGW